MVLIGMTDEHDIDLVNTPGLKEGNQHLFSLTKTVEKAVARVIHQGAAIGLNHHSKALPYIQHTDPQRCCALRTDVEVDQSDRHQP